MAEVARQLGRVGAEADAPTSTSPSPTAVPMPSGAVETARGRGRRGAAVDGRRAFRGCSGPPLPATPGRVRGRGPAVGLPGRRAAAGGGGAARRHRATPAPAAAAVLALVAASRPWRSASPSGRTARPPRRRPGLRPPGRRRARARPPRTTASPSPSASSSAPAADDQRARPPDRDPAADADPEPTPSRPGVDRSGRHGSPRPRAAARCGARTTTPCCPGDLDAGWARLTPRYQRTTARNRATYESFWGAIDAVSVSDVTASAPGSVTATVTYDYADGRVFVERTTYRLVRAGREAEDRPLEGAEQQAALTAHRSTCPDARRAPTPGGAEDPSVSAARVSRSG